MVPGDKMNSLDAILSSIWMQRLNAYDDSLQDQDLLRDTISRAVNHSRSLAHVIDPIRFSRTENDYQDFCVLDRLNYTLENPSLISRFVQIVAFPIILLESSLRQIPRLSFDFYHTKRCLRLIDNWLEMAPESFQRKTHDIVSSLLKLESRKLKTNAIQAVLSGLLVTSAGVFVFTYSTHPSSWKSTISALVFAVSALAILGFRFYRYTNCKARDAESVDAILGTMRNNVEVLDFAERRVSDEHGDRDLLVRSLAIHLISKQLFQAPIRAIDGTYTERVKHCVRDMWQHLSAISYLLTQEDAGTQEDLRSLSSLTEATTFSQQSQELAFSDSSEGLRLYISNESHSSSHDFIFKSEEQV